MRQSRLIFVVIMHLQNKTQVQRTEIFIRLISETLMNVNKVISGVHNGIFGDCNWTRPEIELI